MMRKVRKSRPKLFLVYRLSGKSGWDVFSDTIAVFRLVRKLTEIKEGADYDGDGIIPAPQAPLFTKEGFWVFWGDYSIVHGHPYEMNGASREAEIAEWRETNCFCRTS